MTAGETATWSNVHAWCATWSSASRHTPRDTAPDVKLNVPLSTAVSRYDALLYLVMMSVRVLTSGPAALGCSLRLRPPFRWLPKPWPQRLSLLAREATVIPDVPLQCGQDNMAKREVAVAMHMLSSHTPHGHLLA